jgi:NAD(P)-dependent dehydrogenase (short-subunit alcohol dehydrogenase family)
LRHQFFAAQAVVPGMRAAGGGAIVNVGSISWHLGLSNLVVYQTAKAGIEGLTRALARELGRDNIRVSTIVPGSVQTPPPGQGGTRPKRRTRSWPLNVSVIASSRPM